MKFYGYFRSSAAYRLRIALNLKGLDPERAYIHLTKGGGEQFGAAYRAINPQQLLPALVLDDGAVLTQSLAIIEYLDETHPAPPLLPTAPADRAFVRSVAQAIACDIHPLNNLRVLAYVKQTLGHSDAEKDEWYRHWVATGFTALEAMLAGHKGRGRFCHGDAPTLADLCLVPQVANAERFNCPMEDYPTIRAIAAECRALPAFAAAAPDKQPDAA
jgi:maleylacetoacetate isomerase